MGFQLRAGGIKRENEPLARWISDHREAAANCRRAEGNRAAQASEHESLISDHGAFSEAVRA